ncbi:MAG: hypothetical protein JW750_01195, partial [Anaerolineaceae bacterium]|nr:hypothetical protein [Anaerolineaceae bacterium]
AKIAFVYPGAFNSYLGMGRELFHLYPDLHDWLSSFTDQPADAYQARKLFPPNLEQMSDSEREEAEQALVNDPLAMLFSGTSIAGLYTHLLTHTFGIYPDAAFGYSLGETSMLFAAGLWGNADPMREEVQSMPTFQHRIAGDLQAVREHWALQDGISDSTSAEIWHNYILMTNPEKAREAIAAEPRVYLTHINAPRQLVIGGEPAACKRVIEQLKCMSYRVPYNYALHCEAISSEFEPLRDLHMQPIDGIPLPRLYGGLEKQPLPLDASLIADNVAAALCNRVDFPALVRKVYEDGHQIFIEVGARGNCAKWIEAILKKEAVCSVSLNQAAVPNHLSILRALAKLAAHQVYHPQHTEQLTVAIDMLHQQAIYTA